jgi:hypothetical protein
MSVYLVGVHLTGVYLIVHLTGHASHGRVPRGRVPHRRVPYWACTLLSLQTDLRTSETVSIYLLEEGTTKMKFVGRWSL